MSPFYKVQVVRTLVALVVGAALIWLATDPSLVSLVVVIVLAVGAVVLDRRFGIPALARADRRDPRGE